MNNYKLNLEKYAALARQAAAEGCVLLENRDQALPLKAGEKVLKAYWTANGLPTKESPNGNLLIERDQIKAYVDKQMERARKTINQLFEEKTDIEMLLYKIEQLLNDKAGFWFMSDYGIPKTEYTFLSDLLKSGKKTFEMELLQVFDYHM